MKRHLIENILVRDRFEYHIHLRMLSTSETDRKSVAQEMIQSIPSELTQQRLKGVCICRSKSRPRPESPVYEIVFHQ